MIDEDKIIAYVLGELDESEHQKVAQAIAQDEQLQETVEQYQKIKSGFRAKRIDHQMNQIAAFEDSFIDQDPKPDQKLTNRRNYLGKNGLIGLFLFILLTTVCIFFYGKAYYSNVGLAKKYFLMPTDPSVAGNQEATTFAAAIEAFFNHKNYEEAASLLASISDTSAYASQAKYYKAHADYLRGDYDKALDDFTLLSNNKRIYPPDQLRNIEWNEMISRLAIGKSINPLPNQWLASKQGQSLNKDLQSIWRSFFD